MRALHWCLLLTVTACSSPYPFSEEVADLNTTAERLSDAFTAHYAGLSDDRSAELHFRLLDHRGLVAYPLSCGKPTAAGELRQPCALYPQNGEPPALTNAEHHQATTLHKVRSLMAYVQALHAITKAADRTAFNGAAKRVEATVTNLSAAANLAAPGAGAILPAVTNLVLWVVGEKLDQDRYDALKLAVNEAHKPVTVVASHLGTALQEIKSNRQTILSRTVGILRQRLYGGAPGDENRLTQTEAALAKFDVVGRTDATAPTTALIAAHRALVIAVNDPKTDYSALITALTDFAQKTQVVYDAAIAASK
jgi:hypothetical protein